MGKTKQKQRSEISYLKGIINALRKENRILKQQLKSSLISTDSKEKECLNCPECDKGQLDILDLGHIIIYSCNMCEFKQKEK